MYIYIYIYIYVYVYVCVFVFVCIGISEKVEEMIKKRELYNNVFKHDRLLIPVQMFNSYTATIISLYI